MTCQKVSYPDRAAALEDIKSIRAHRIFRRKYQKNAKSGRKLRTYCCPHCGNWHLTTQKPRKR